MGLIHIQPIIPYTDSGEMGFRRILFQTEPVYRGRQKQSAFSFLLLPGKMNQQVHLWY